MDLLANLLALLDRRERGLLRSICRMAERGSGNVMLDEEARALAVRLPALLRLSDGVSLAEEVDPHIVLKLLQDSESALPDSDAAGLIRHLQMNGKEDEAVDEFKREGGIYFIHYHGVAATLDVLNRFSDKAFADHEVLSLALAMHALKTGNVGHAQFVVRRRFGTPMATLEAALAAGPALTAEARVFRFVMSLYEDGTVSSQLRERLFDLVAEFPVDDHLHRGSFYNAMLGVCIQRQEFDVAEDIAVRAHHHYRAARCHLLIFYIDVHSVVFSLRRGQIGTAEIALRAARASLDQVTFDVAADRRLLDLLSATVRFEQGEPEELVRFITDQFDAFAYGEIWPVVVELALVYCSRVLASQVGIGAALTFLDKWRIQEWRSRRFHLAITMREIDIFQSAGRWQAATDRLIAVQSRINLTWIETASEALTRLVDPVEVELVFAWLRHLIHHIPKRPLLREQVAALMRNTALLERERGRLMLWAAYLARVGKDIDQSRRHFAQLLEECARLGTVTHILGDMTLIVDLMDDRRIASHVRASGTHRQVLRQIERHLDRHPDRHPQGTLLTRQEIRVLRLVADGASNKAAARQLRLAEVTVKFHLTNIFRKIGVSRRREAIAAARALGWID